MFKLFHFLRQERYQCAAQYSSASNRELLPNTVKHRIEEFLMDDNGRARLLLTIDGMMEKKNVLEYNSKNAKKKDLPTMTT